MSEVFFVLPSAVVVDRQVFNKVPTAELPEVIMKIYNARGGATPTFINNLSKFKSREELVKALETNDSTLFLRLELNGIELSVEEFSTVAKFVELKATVDKLLGVPEPIITETGTYTFAKPPEGWDGSKIKIKTDRITRGTNTIGRAAAKKLWDTFSPRWAGDKTARTTVTIVAGGYSRVASLSGDVIQVGCQKIRRHELEYVARQLGWPFPG